MLTSALNTSSAATENSGIRTDARFAALEVPAGVLIAIPLESKDRDCLGLWVDDPVFRNVGLGIIAPLIDQVALRLIFIDDFQAGRRQAKSGSAGACRLRKAAT